MKGEERKGKQAGKCQDMDIRCTIYSRYYYLLLLPTRRHCTYYLINQSINQFIYPSIHLSIYLSIVHIQRMLTCLLAYLLAYLLTCWLAVVVVERST